MANRTIPATRVRVEPVACETRGAFTAQLFVLRYGRGVPSDGLLVMIPNQRPTSRSVRIFYGTAERGGELEAISALSSVDRVEGDGTEQQTLRGALTPFATGGWLGPNPAARK